MGEQAGQVVTKISGEVATIARHGSSVMRCFALLAAIVGFQLAYAGPVAATTAGPPAATVDVDKLANVLSTAFLAQNLTIVCSQQDRWFVEDTKGATGDGRQFADHIKAEVLSRLSDKDAGLVVIGAANAARTISLGMVHVMIGDSAEEEQKRLDAWCESTAKAVVRGILAQHDIRHDLYERVLRDAKQKGENEPLKP